MAKQIKHGNEFVSEKFKYNIVVGFLFFATGFAFGVLAVVLLMNEKPI